MPASVAIPSAGSFLSLDSGAGLVALAEIEDIEGLEIDIASIDRTNLTSPSTYKESMPGWREVADVAITANFNAAGLVILLATTTTAGTAGIKPWRITLSNGSKWDFSAYITKVGTSIPLEEGIKMPFALKVTGPPTFTP